MKVIKIILALVLTLAMLYIARNNSRGRPEFYTLDQNGYHFEYNTVPKGPELSKASVPLTIRGKLDDNNMPVFRRSPDGIENNRMDVYDARVMQPCDSAADCYRIEVTTGKKNDRFYYYFEVVDTAGVALATFTQPDGSPFMLRYIGAVPVAVTVTHIALIFATVFFISLGTIHSLTLIRGSSDVKPLARYSFLAALCAFLGGYPFGIPMNWFAFGTIWEGVPFGTDATDNKTQLLFIYLLLVFLASLGSFRGKPERNLFSSRTLGWFGVGSFAVMLFIYLIPHSIQFSPTLTYAFCYSWIAAAVLIYILGRITIRRA